MKCPYCRKQIKDDAVFCGFCGKQVTQKPLKEASLSPPSNAVKTEVPEGADDVPSETVKGTKKKKPKDKPKKKRTVVKVLLIFVLLAFLGGSVLGFLSARGVVSLEALMPDSNFMWTSFSEGQSETTEVEDTSEDKESVKKENSETSSPADEEAETSPSAETSSPADEEAETSPSAETSSPADEEAETNPSAETTDSSSETISSDETQQPTENDVHYAKYIGDSLVIIDDRAHIWEETTIDGIMTNAKEMSELSDYSIMIVVTYDMFEMTSAEFADDYYGYVSASDEGDAELIADGYLFLINLADRECYLSTYGEAIDVYTDAAIDELFNEIQQFMVDENYEAAVNKVIEKTIF